MEKKKAKILVVEDNVELSDLYIARLELEGYEVQLVEDGEKALAVATEYMPDLILLDIMMPRLSGYDVLDILRNTDKTKNIKIVLLTALSQLQDKTRGAELGADDYLVKSESNLDDMVACIEKYI